MFSLSSADAVAQQIMLCTDFSEMQELFGYITHELTCDYFALYHHPALQGRCRDLRIHNYPAEWEARYDRCQLGISDPIHRASQKRGSGFRWRDVPSIIPFTERDAAMLQEARQFGIYDGYTVPAHVPGERPGSITFAFGADHDFADGALILAEGIGHIAFERARQIEGRPLWRASPRVTDRQLEIVILIGQDKTNSEIGDILGIREDTVMKHVHNICERFDAVRRTSLPLRAVFAGLLHFTDILPPFR